MIFFENHIFISSAIRSSLKYASFINAGGKRVRCT